jgi:hypothetical protein
MNLQQVLGLPAVFVAIGAIAGGTLTGFLYLLGLFGRAREDEVKTAKNAADFVITSLEKKIKILEQSIDEMKSRLDSIENENRILREVLQGKDGATTQFQNNVMETLGRLDGNVKVLLTATTTVPLGTQTN